VKLLPGAEIGAGAPEAVVDRAIRHTTRYLNRERINVSVEVNGRAMGLGKTSGSIYACIAWSLIGDNFNFVFFR
jgi:hypothetical protein